MSRLKETSGPETAPENIQVRTSRELFNFRRIWWLSFLLTAGFAIVPVVFFAVIDYNVTHRMVAADAVARASRLTSNAWRSIAFFLDERKNALTFAVHDNSFDALSDTRRLSEILENLRKSFGGFTDIGVIDARGVQRTYVGPYSLGGKDYSQQPWFTKVLEQGIFISDVFLGYRNVPHLVIAIKYVNDDGGFFVLRATMEHQLTNILAEAKGGAIGDAFMINKEGILQTPSLIFGNVLDKVTLTVPPPANETEVMENVDVGGLYQIMVYRYIPGTPFILMVIKDKQKLMEPWRQSRVDLIGYLVISITIILMWIWGVTTFLVRRMKLTDRRRVKYFHMAEYSNKMASIGRLAAGVAHEINNPLAIINEKAGLIKDMFHFKKVYKEDPKLAQTVDAILNSVERCSRITRQLLNFARHMNVSIQHINLNTVVHEVLGFLSKEAEYRAIELFVDIPDTIPDFDCDRGKLQQVLLNLANNALAALSTGGKLRINATMDGDKFIRMEISDNGCGIPPENLKHIFEPFFSTKTAMGGTGLGLSITYGLVQELGGRIEVNSALGTGTTFTILLPLKGPEKDDQNACTSS